MRNADRLCRQEHQVLLEHEWGERESEGQAVRPAQPRCQHLRCARLPVTLLYAILFHDCVFRSAGFQEQIDLALKLIKRKFKGHSINYSPAQPEQLPQVPTDYMQVLVLRT